MDGEGEEAFETVGLAERAAGQNPVQLKDDLFVGIPAGFQARLYDRIPEWHSSYCMSGG
jgi:hypothetical protein